MRLTLEIGKKFPDITGPISDAFTEELNRIVQLDGFSELILDFNGLRGINSMAMGTIFTVSQKLKGKGKMLQIVNAPDKIARLLQMVKLNDIMAS